MRAIIAVSVIVLLSACSQAPVAPEAAQSAEGIRTVVKQHLRDISDCYTQLATNKPEWSGRVIMEWTINDEGKVINCKAAKITAPGAESLGKCMSQKIMSWKFTPAAKDENAAIRYPFVFSTKSKVSLVGGKNKKPARS